jgi:hypothetical protein
MELRTLNTDITFLYTEDYVMILTLGWKMLPESSVVCTAESTAFVVKSITDVSDTWLTTDFEELKCFGTKPGSLISSRTLVWYTGVTESVKHQLGMSLIITLS